MSHTDTDRRIAKIAIHSVTVVLGLLGVYVALNPRPDTPETIVFIGFAASAWLLYDGAFELYWHFR